MHKYVKGASVVSIVIFLITLPVFAEGHTLVGNVTDSEGDPLIGVLISILPMHQENTEKLVTVTDVKGNYHFNNLTRAKYKVAASTLDGKNFQEKTVNIEQGYKYRRDFILNLEATKSMQRHSVDREWVLRSGKRDILRKENMPKEEKIASIEHPEVNSASGFKGQISVTKDAFLENKTSNSNTTELNLSGSLGSYNDWYLKAQLKETEQLQPTLLAIGKYRHQIWSGMDMELGVDYKKYANMDADNAIQSPELSNNKWRSSLYTKNTWHVWEPLQLNCTLKYDHYNYLKSGDYLSPQVEIIYEPSEWAKMRTSVGVQTRYPENVLTDFDEIPAHLEDGMEPERTAKYEISFEGGFGGGYIITFRAYYSDITNKQVAFRKPSGNKMGRYLYNAGDSVIKGLSLNFQNKTDSWLTGSLSYNLSKAVVLDTERLSLVFDNINQIENLLGEEIAHELSTILNAEIDATETVLSAEYKVVVGTLGAEEVSEGLIDAQRLDIQIIQKLPFLAFTGTDWEIHLNVRNIFNTQGMNYFLNNEELMGVHRKISGGVSIHF